MSSVTPYVFDGNSVRVVMIDSEPWFVANDVCSALGIASPRVAVDRIDDDCVCLADVIDSIGRVRSTNVVSEPGLYELIFRSDKPEAARFRKWVTGDVLPTIRKTGTYGNPEPKDDLDAIEDTIKAIRAQRARIAAVEGRQDTMEAHLAGVLGQYDEFTALAYAKLNDLKTDRPYLMRLGRRAAEIMRMRGTEPRKRQDATFGAVNIYPVEFLDAAARDLS